VTAYDVLGVPRTAEAAEIKAAYRRLAARHHPDAPGGDEERMKTVNAAYDAVSDPERRAAYDTETFGVRCTMNIEEFAMFVEIDADLAAVDVMATLATMMNMGLLDKESAMRHIEEMLRPGDAGGRDGVGRAARGRTRNG
jgi:curved DNA-binding protein CbpA